MLEQITPLIITLNEAPNIARTLDKLRWAKRIVIVDSGSTDGTLELLQGYPQVDVLHHPFEDFAIQWNYGLAQVASAWVLSLDADYELGELLVENLASLAPADDTAGYAARFIYRIHGRPLRGSLYPPRTVLFRKDRASYVMEGHTQRVVVDGDVLPLGGIIFHDDRKPLARWIASQSRYAREEAQYLLGIDRARLTRADRIRLMGWPAPFAVLFYALIAKGCVFDGWAGWCYVLQRVITEALIALELIAHRMRWDNAREAEMAATGSDHPRP